MNSLPRVSIALCSYNREKLVKECLRSVFAQDYPVHSVHLVDNASTDNTVVQVSNEFGDRVCIHRNPENFGSSGGFNQAVSRALEDKPDYLLLLDSDCVLGDAAIRCMTDYLENHEDTWMVGPKVYWPGSHGLVQELGADLDWKKAEFVPRYRNFDETKEGLLVGEDDVDYIAACCLMVRRSAILEVGNLDPDYFIYFDDIEWAQRMKLKGGNIRAMTGAHAFHHSGGANKRNHFSTYYYWRNRTKFFFQYTPSSFYAVMRDSLFESYVRAIATNKVLRLKNAACVIERAVIDAIGDKWGRNDFDHLDIRLDEPSPFLVEPTSSALKVEHIFESKSDQSNPIIVDRFGKCIRTQTVGELASSYEQVLKQTKMRLMPYFVTSHE